MAWIEANEPLSAFDYNGNGRIDFADVVWLFGSLGSSPARTYRVTAAAVGPGRISPSGVVAVPAGGNVTFALRSESALPGPTGTQSGYRVACRVLVDPAVAPTPYPAGHYAPYIDFTPSYTLENVRADHTVYGVFSYFVMYA
jgi:hypothetical protein